MATQKNLVISRSDGKVEVIPLTPGMKIKVVPGATYSVVADGVLVPAQITNDGRGNAVLKIASGGGADVPSLIEISDYYSPIDGRGSLIFTRAEGSGQIIAVPSSSTAAAEVKPLPNTQVTSTSLVRGIAAPSPVLANQESVLQSLENPLLGSRIAKSVEALANQGLYLDAKTTPLSFTAGSDPTSSLGQLSGALAPISEDKTPPEQAVLLNNAVGQRVLRGTGEAGATAIVMDASGNVLARIPVGSDGQWSLDYKTTNPPMADGLIKVRVLLQDAFGNLSTPLDTTVVVDTTSPLAPVMDASIATPGGNYATVLTNGTGATSSRQPQFSGTAGVDAQGQPEANIRINLYDNGVLIGTTVSDASGHWTIVPSSALKEGAHRFTVTGLDSSGNESSPSSPYSLTVDTRAPTGLAFIDQVNDKVEPLTGNYPSGVGQDAPSLNDKRPTVSGRSGGGAGETVLIYRNGVEVATVIPSAGRWSYQETADLTDGQYTYTTRLIDKAGNKGTLSAAFVFSVDTVAPVRADALTILADDGVTVIGLGGVTNSRTPTIKLHAESGATITVFDQLTSSAIGQMTESPAGSGNYQFTSPRLSSSAYQWSFLVADKAGNVLSLDDSLRVNFEVQTIGPSQTIFIDSMGLDSGQSAIDFVTNFGGASSADGKETRLLTGRLSSALSSNTVKLQVSQDNGVTWRDATVNGQQWFYNDTVNHTSNWSYKTRLIDAVGNVGDSMPEQNVILDQSAPTSGGAISVDAYLQAGTPALPVNFATVTSNNGVRVTYNLTGTGAKVGDLVEVTWGSGENAKTQTVVITAIDAARPTTPVSQVVVVFDASTIQSAGSSNALPIKGRVVDAAGNAGPYSNTLNVSLDVVAPATPTLSMVAGESLADGYLNAAERGQVLTFNLTETGDAAAQEGDQVTLLVINKETRAVVSTQVTLSSADIANKSFQVGLPSSVTSALVSGGEYDLRVKIKDKAGNESVQAFQTSFTFDSVAPDAPTLTSNASGVVISTPRDDVASITSGGTTRDPYPTISGRAEANSKVSVFDQVTGLKVGEANADASGNWSFTVPSSSPLADRVHTWYTVATDQAGNIDLSHKSATVSFTVHAQGPTQLITIDSMTKDSGASATDFVTNDGSNPRVVKGSLSAALTAGQVLQVSLDNGANWTTVVPTGTAWTYTDTATHTGNWNIKARLTDSSNLVGAGATTQEVILDTLAPLAPVTTFAGSAVADGIINLQDLKTAPITINSDLTGSNARVGDTLTFTWGSLTRKVVLKQVDIDSRTVSAIFTLSDLNKITDGTYTVSAQLTDQAGNVGGVSEASYSGSSGSGNSIVLGTHPPIAPRITLSSNLADQVINLADYNARTGTLYTITAELNNTNIQPGGKAMLIWGGVTVASTIINQTHMDNRQVTWSLDDLIQRDGYDSAKWNGSHNVTVTLVDKVGNASVPKVLGSFTVDTVAPDAPTVSTIDTTEGSSSSSSSIAVNGATTSVQRPKIVGTGEPNALIAVFDDSGAQVDTNGDGLVLSRNSQGVLVDSSGRSTDSAGVRYDAGNYAADYVTVDSTGAWTFQPPSVLANGLHTYSFKALDSAFNVSPMSETVSFTVDSHAPTQVVTIDAISQDSGFANDFITNIGSNQEVTGTIQGSLSAGVKLVVVIDGVTYNNPTISAPDAAGNIHWTVRDTRAHSKNWGITAFLTDLTHSTAGAAISKSVILDTEGPSAPLSVSVVDNSGNDLSSSVTGVNAQNNGGVFLLVQFDPTQASLNTNVTVLLRSNTSGTQIALDLGDTAKLSRTDINNGFIKIQVPQSVLDAANVQGDIRFYVNLNDAAGNASPASQTALVHVDTVPPLSTNLLATVSGDSAVSMADRVAGVTLSGTAEPGAKVSLTWNLGDPGNSSSRNVLTRSSADGQIVVGADGRWSVVIPASDIPDNVRYQTSLTVLQTDSAGNVATTPSVSEVLLSTQPPGDLTLNLTSSNRLFGDDIVNLDEKNSGVTISGMGGAIGATVNLSWGTFTSSVRVTDTSGAWSIVVPRASIPADTATSTVQVFQSDDLGNSSGMTRHQVVIDTAVPSAPGINQIQGDDIVNSAEEAAGVVVSGTQAEIGSTVFVSWIADGTTITTSTSVVSALGAWSVNFSDSAARPLPKGAHMTSNFSVWQVDSAGNQSAINTREVLVDTTAPSVVTLSRDVAVNIDSITADAGRIPLSGTGEPDSRVSVIIKGGDNPQYWLTKNALVDSSGNWTLNLVYSDDIIGRPPGSPAGTVYVPDSVATPMTILQTDSAGNVSTPLVKSLLRDTVAPDSPSIGADVATQVVDGQTLDYLSGAPVINKAKVDSGFVFNLSGVESSSLGAQFKWVEGSLSPVNAVKNASGVWQISLTSSDIPFAAGAVRSYQLIQTDSAGNVTTTVTSRSVRIDTAEPNQPVLSLANLHPDPTEAGKSYLNLSNKTAGVLTAEVSNLENLSNGAHATLIWNDTSSSSSWSGHSVIVTASTRKNSAGNYLVDFNELDFPPNGTSTRITAVQTDSAGNVSSMTISDLIQVDFTAPTRPSFGVTGASTSASGLLANLDTATQAEKTDLFINKKERDAGITVMGTGEVGATVNLGFNVTGGTTKQTTVGADGKWSVTLATSDIPETNPNASITVTQTDTAGNVNTGGARTLSNIVIDATAPDLTSYKLLEQNLATGAHGDGVLNLDEKNSGVVLSNSAIVNTDIARVKVIWGSFTETVTTNSGVWSVTVPSANLPTTDAGIDGDHKSKITVHYFDASGNETSSSAKMTLPTGDVDFVKLDYTAPTTLTVAAVGTNDVVNSDARNRASGVTVSGTGEAGADIKLTWGNTVKTGRVGSDGNWNLVFNSTDNVGTDSASSTITVTQTDSAGNVAAVAVNHTLNLDTTAPTTALTVATVAGNDRINNTEKQSDIVITGTAEAGASVNLSWAGLAGTATTGSTRANASGAWSITIPKESIPADGATKVVVTQTDSAGNVSSASTTHAVSIDTALPNAPTVFVVASNDIINATKKSASQADGTTGVLVSGVAEANATGFVTWGNVSHAYTASASGNWSSVFTTSEVPADGSSTIVANQTDTAGNVSETYSTSRRVVVDTTAPTSASLTINAVATDNMINSVEKAANLNLSGNAENGATVNIVWGSTTKAAIVRSFNGNGSWSVAFAPSDMPTGDSASSTITVTQTDSAGNVSATPLTKSVVIDTAVSTPTMSNVTANTLGDNLVNSTQKTNGVSFSGTGENNNTVNVLWGSQTISTTVSGGTWSVSFAASQVPADGTVVATVMQTDSAGNVSSSVTKSILIDTVVDAPVVSTATGAISAAAGADSVIGTIAKSADIYINNYEKTNGFTMSGTAEKGSASAFSKINLVWAGNTKTVTADASGSWSAQFSVSDMATFSTEGATYTVSVTQTDTVGNVSSVTQQQLILDTQLNSPTSGTSPGGTINATQQASGIVVDAAAQTDVVSMVFTWNSKTYQATNVAGSTNWRATIPSSDIPTGANTTLVLSVYAVDSAGNRSAVNTQNVVVDTVAPSTSPDSGLTIAEDFVVGSSERLGGFDLKGVVDPNSNIRVVLDDNAGHFITVTATSNELGAWSARVANLPSTSFADNDTAYASITQLDAAGNSSTFVRTFKTQSVAVTLTGTALALDTPNTGVYGTYSVGDKINFTFSEGISIANLNRAGAVSVGSGKSLGTGSVFSGVGNPDTIFMSGVSDKFVGQYSLLTNTAPTGTVVGAATLNAFKQSLFNNADNTLSQQFDMLTGTNSVDLTKPIYKNGNKYIFALVGGGYVLADFSAPASATSEWYYSSDVNGTFAGGADPSASTIAGWFKATSASTNQVGGTSSSVSSAVGAGYYNTVQLTLGTGTNLVESDPITFAQSSGSSGAGVFSGGGNTLSASTNASTPKVNFVTPLPTNPIVAEDSSGGDGVKNNSVVLNFNLATKGFALADLTVSNGRNLGVGATVVGVSGTESPVGSGYFTQWRVTYGTGFTVTTGDTITIAANKLLINSGSGVANPTGSNAVFTMPDIVGPGVAATTPLTTLDLDFNGAKNDGVVIRFNESIKLGSLLSYNAATGAYQFSSTAAVAITGGRNLGTNYKVIAIGADGKDLSPDSSLSSSSTSLAKDFRIEFGADKTISANGSSNDAITIAKAGVVDANGNTATGSVTFTMTDIIAPNTLTPPLSISGDNVVSNSEKTAGVSIGFTGGVVGEKVHYYINGVELVSKATTLTAVNPSLSLSAADWGADGVKTVTTRLEDSAGNFSDFSGPKSVLVDTQVQGIKSVSVTNHPSASTTSFAQNDVIQLTFDEPVNLSTASLGSQFGTGATVASQGSYTVNSVSVSNVWNVTVGSSPTITPGGTISLVSGTVKDASGNTSMAAITKPLPADILDVPTSIIIDNVTADNVINASEGAAARSISMKLTGAKVGDVVKLYMDGEVVGSATVSSAGQTSINIDVPANGWGADGQRTLSAEIQRGSGALISSPIRSVYVAETQGHWSTLGTRVTWFDPDTLTTPDGTNIGAAGGAGWTASVGRDGAGNLAVARAPTTGTKKIIQVRDASGHNVLVFDGAASASYLSFYQGAQADLPDASKGIMTVNATKLLSTAGSWNYTTTFDLNSAGQVRRLHFGYGLDSKGFTAHWSGNGFNTPANTATANVWQTLMAYMDDKGESVLLNDSVIASTPYSTANSGTVTTQGRVFRIGTSVAGGTASTITDNTTAQNAAPSSEYYSGLLGDVISIEGTYSTQVRAELNVYQTVKFRAQGNYRTPNSVSVLYDLSESANSGVLIDDAALLNEFKLGIGNDTVITAGADYVNTGAGQDVIRVKDLKFRQLDAGKGRDTLVIDAGYIGASTIELSDFVSNARGLATTGQNDNLTAADNTRVNNAGWHKLYGIESIDLATNTGAQTLRLRKADVKQLSEDNILRVNLGAGDRLELMDETSTAGAAQWNQWEGLFTETVNGTTYTYNQKFVAADGSGTTIFANGGVTAPHTVGAALSGAVLSVAFDATLGAVPSDMSKFTLTNLNGTALATTVSSVTLTTGFFGRSLDLTLSSAPTSAFIINYAGSQINESGSTRDTLVKKWYVGTSLGDTLDASAQTQSVGVFGLAGNNILKGGSGSDMLVVDGAGNNTLTGGSNTSGDVISDTYVIRKGHTQGTVGGSDVITDFDKTDKLNLTDLLSGYTNDVTQRDKYLKLVGDGAGNLRLSIDKDGIPFGQSFTETNSVVLKGLSGITFNGNVLDANYIDNTLSKDAASLRTLLQQLLDQNNIITH